MVSEQSDRFTDAALRVALGERPFRFSPQTGSTNDIAREWALSGVLSGAVALTEEQTAGRGRFRRTWQAPPGSALLMSVILRPPSDPEWLPRLTMVGAVAVSEALTALVSDPLRVGLKWPNDVQLDGRKVCGILAEAVWQGETLRAAILGIGLNVRIDFAGSPLAESAISIEPALGRRVDRLALLADVLHRVDQWAAQLGSPALLAGWRARLTTLGQQVRVVPADDPSAAISGQAVDVDENGALVLRDEHGTLRRMLAGEVTLNHP